MKHQNLILTVIFSFQITTNSYHCDINGNKAKGRISKRVFQENKAHQVFRKTNISYGKFFVFREICHALFF